MPATTPNVLVVDDDFATREVLSWCLKSQGYRVRTAENGQVALERLREDPFLDLIVLDLKMPVMDGWTFREHQRQNPVFSSIPVFVVSAESNLARIASELEVAGYFVKPVETAEFLATVRRFQKEHTPTPRLASALSLSDLIWNSLFIPIDLSQRLWSVLLVPPFWFGPKCELVVRRPSIEG